MPGGQDILSPLPASSTQSKGKELDWVVPGYRGKQSEGDVQVLLGTTVGGSGALESSVNTLQT